MEGRGFKSPHLNVTHYEITEAQKRFLRKKFAREHDEETGCDCPGDCEIETCKGFTRNCTCDQRSILAELRDEIATKKALDAQEPRF
jgi:hypothetical protein